MQDALGVNLNYTSSNLLYTAFTLSGDFAIGYLKDIEKLLEMDVQVALVFGDADYICNWRGGEALSLAAKWSGSDDFSDAGYTNLMVGGKAYGETRQFGKLSFTRVWNAGHEIPCKHNPSHPPGPTTPNIPSRLPTCGIIPDLQPNHQSIRHCHW